MNQLNFNFFYLSKLLSFKKLGLFIYSFEYLEEICVIFFINERDRKLEKKIMIFVNVTKPTKLVLIYRSQKNIIHDIFLFFEIYLMKK